MVNKKDVENALAIKILSGRHYAMMGEVRLQMVNLTNALDALTTILNAGRSGRIKQPMPTDCESDAGSPVKPPPQKRGKKNYKAGGNWAPGMWFRHSWPKATKDA